jgi:hypothetical protein
LKWLSGYDSVGDANLEGTMAHRRIGQEAFQFDAKAELKSNPRNPEPCGHGNASN